MTKSNVNKSKSVSRTAKSGRLVKTLNEGYVRKGGVNTASSITHRPAAAVGIKPNAAKSTNTKKQ